MTDTFVVYDNKFENVLGVFSTEEYALEFVESSKFLGYSDLDFSIIEFDMDGLKEKISILNEMKSEDESIYYLYATGIVVGGVMHWGNWSVNRMEYVSGVLDFLIRKENYVVEYKTKYNSDEGRRTGIVKAHSVEEAIKIAKEVMVQL